jgi:putative flippase GtrA
MSTKLAISDNKSNLNTELGRFFRFGLVGASSTLLDFAVLSTLKYFFGWATLPANIISYSCGTINSYILNRYWVYPEIRNRQNFVQFLQFVLINIIGLGLNVLLVTLLEKPAGQLLGNAAYGYLPAKIAATLIVFLWNFFANRFWTFSDLNQKPKPEYSL